MMAIQAKTGNYRSTFSRAMRGLLIQLTFAKPDIRKAWVISQPCANLFGKFGLNSSKDGTP